MAEVDPTNSSVREEEDNIRAAYRAGAADDFMLFVSGLVIPSASGPQRFGSCMEPFQTECFRSLAPSLRAVRDGYMPPWRRFWMERTKKASKDNDLACCLLWLMAFPIRPVLVQVCAADQKQAGIIKRRVVDLLYYNLWLDELVCVQQNRILGAGRLGETVIEATDATGGAHGETPDLLILNELVHVAKWPVMEAHMNNATGVPRGVVVVSTNAGFKGEKPEVWRKTALADKDRWRVHIWDKRAPWVSAEDVAEAKRRDPIGAEYSRLWGGKWISGVGDAVTEEAIDACFRADGPLEGPEAGWIYFAGLDLGVSHDHAGIVVVGANEAEQRLRVAWLKGWRPSVPNNKGVLEVDSEAVEEACVTACELFRVWWFGYDPAAGGSFMAQRLRKRGLEMREMSFGATNLTLMATTFVQALSDRRLECYEDDEGRLRRDFGKFDITYKPPGRYKLEAVSDEYGHADVGTALVICLPEAVALLDGVQGLSSDDVLAREDDGKPLSDEEVEDLPDELRGIYNAIGKEWEGDRRSRSRYDPKYDV